MTTVSIEEARMHLSTLIEQVLAGEDVLIARNQQPIVRLVREIPVGKKPLLGALKGKFTVDAALSEPLSEDELATWYDGKL